MPGVQRFFAGNTNLIRAAVLTASGVRPSATVRRTATTRAGNGRVALSGSYSGHEESTFDVEILSGGSTARVTAPVMVGVGSGDLSGLAATSGVAAQTFTVRLVSLGTDTAAASLSLGNHLLIATPAGAGGNATYLTVDESALLATASDYALAAEWAAGQDYQEGDQWNFGGLPLLASGALAPSTPRLRFGDDLQVYRPYRTFEAGKWRHHLTPTPARTLKKGWRVYTVTGTYTVTVTRGATVEPYAALVTLYDLLLALQTAPSALIEVGGVVADDATPGGQSAIDVPLRTSAYALPVDFDGAPTAAPLTLADLTIDPTAATEEVVIECTDASIAGAERWSVEGSVSGKLAEAESGVAYLAPRFGFTIPRRLPSSTEPKGNVSFSFTPGYRAQETTPPPNVCLESRLGALAKNNSIVFTYRKRPTNECACEDVLYKGQFSSKCLGLQLQEGQTMPLDPAAQTRLESLYAWRATYIRGNTGLSVGNSGSVELLASIEDIELIDHVARRFTDAVVKGYAVTAAMTEWDSAFTEAQADLAVLASSAGGGASANPNAAARIWEPGVYYRADELAIPTARNGHWYEAQGAGYTGQTEPTWPIAGGTVVDDEITWQDLGAYWTPSAAYSPPTTINPHDGYTYECTTGGTSGATEPQWDGATVADGTVVWTRVVAGLNDIRLKEPITTITAPGAAGQPGGATVCGLPPVQTTYLVVARSTGPGWEYELWETTPGAGSIKLATYTTQGAADAEKALKDQAAAAAYSLAQAKYQACLDAHPEVTPGDPVVTTINNRVITVQQFAQRYFARMDTVLVKAGIVPNFSNASSQGSACWQDQPDLYWWVADGTDYLPAFTNVVYHSARRTANGAIESTKEFALVIKVKCEHRLVEGDSIIVIFNDIVRETTYAVGDRFRLSTIAGAAAYLAGGVDGNDTHTWAVAGSVDGALPNYSVIHGAEADYAQGGLTFKILRGGIPFVLGDEFRFAIEAGQYRWRKGVDAWSGAADIPIGGIAALSDGLSATFVAAAAPSFAAGDSFSFLAVQPNAPSNVQDCFEERWSWPGATATLTADLGSSQTVDALIIARHTLPSGATVTVEGSNNGGATWPLSQALSWRAGPMAVLLETSWTVDRLRLNVAGATDAAIGWWWAGAALALSVNAEESGLRTRYAMSRGAGTNARALYTGKGKGGSVEWNGWLTQADVESIELMSDHCKAGHDEPLVYLPHHLYPDEARLVKIGEDDLDIRDDYKFQPNDRTERRIIMTLPLDPVIE